MLSLMSLACISSLSTSLKLTPDHIFSGTLISHWFNIVKEKIERRNFFFVARVVLSFLDRLVAIFCSLKFELWRTQNNVHPSEAMENNINNDSPAVGAVDGRDHILPCVQRLERLEKAFGELSNKPANIPLEKERMLMDSLDRIKSVEFDLEKTKRVCLYIFSVHS